MAANLNLGQISGWPSLNFEEAYFRIMIRRYTSGSGQLRKLWLEEMTVFPGLSPNYDACSNHNIIYCYAQTVSRRVFQSRLILFERRLRKVHVHSDRNFAISSVYYDWMFQTLITLITENSLRAEQVGQLLNCSRQAQAKFVKIGSNCNRDRECRACWCVVWTRWTTCLLDQKAVRPNVC